MREFFTHYPLLLFSLFLAIIFNSRMHGFSSSLRQILIIDSLICLGLNSFFYLQLLLWMLINFNLIVSQKWERERDAFFLYNFKNLIFRYDLKQVSYLFILLLFKKVTFILFDLVHKGKFYSNMFRGKPQIYRRELNSQETFLSDPSKR